ncbi:hypothetical protein Mterra_00530 [Calidithermus terrae]|uniref:Uncharacterized protein n=1 Tax=Calidithermus terrae TaxID=1408545 RepID=A0A399F4U4_9DEIN|nr:hypothetical protein [Calidithermus terrae]RIH90299.1 hypothetical protein Mterra_00530 [Calidithermus terrae]
MGQSAYVFALERPANARIRVTLRTHEYRHRRAAGAASLAGRVQEWAVQLEWHDGEKGGFSVREYIEEYLAAKAEGREAW